MWLRFSIRRLRGYPNPLIFEPLRHLLRYLIRVNRYVHRDLWSRRGLQLGRVEHDVGLVDHQQDHDAVRNRDVGLGHQYPQEFEDASSFELGLDLLNNKRVSRCTYVSQHPQLVIGRWVLYQLFDHLSKRSVGRHDDARLARLGTDNRLLSGLVGDSYVVKRPDNVGHRDRGYQPVARSGLQKIA
jgi:hypothetical protein